MDWSNLRGKALEAPKKKPLDFKLLEYRIMFLVRHELEEFIKSIKISKSNKYGDWVML
jgi:hypothetical protein